MIIAIRLLAFCLYSLSLSRPFHSFVRSSVHIVQRTDEIHALPFSMYVCVCMLVLIVLRANRRVLLLDRMHPHRGVVVVVAIAAVAICEMGERTKGVEREERKCLRQVTNQH